MEQTDMPEPTFSTPATPVLMGIYAITGPAGRVYVGSSDDIPRRWKQHRSQLRGGRHHNYLLQAAWVAYGEAAFTFAIAEQIAGIDDLIDSEQRHLDAAMTAGPVYNLARDVRVPARGLVHTPEARRKMSLAIKASMTPAALQARSARIQGSLNPVSKLDEGKVREICALLLTGAHPAALAEELGICESTIYQVRRGQIWKHIVTPEMAAAMKAVRQNPWVSGKRTVTPEHRERFAEVGRARKGASPTAERRKQISAQSTGAGNGNATLGEEDVLEIKRLLAAGMRNNDIAPQFDVRPNTVSRIKNGEAWAHVVLSDGEREQIEAEAARRGRPPGNPLTPQHRQRLSEAMTGKPKSGEHKANLWRDREVTDEFRETMAANGRRLKGVEKSDETRRRMSAAQENRVLLTEPQVREIKWLIAEGVLTGAEIGRRFGVGRGAVAAIKAGRTWGHVILDDAPLIPAPRAPEPVQPGDQLHLFT